MISDQNFNAGSKVTRPCCIAVLVIFNTFPCRGITGGAVASLHVLGGVNIFLGGLKNQLNFF